MKVLYLLSFILDMILLPIVLLITFITTIVCYVKDIITGDIKIFNWKLKDYIEQSIVFTKTYISNGLNVHKKRILGV